MLCGHLCSTCRYTLGGVYLARYEDSPAGAFEEVSQQLQKQLQELQDVPTGAPQSLLPPCL